MMRGLLNQTVQATGGVRGIKDVLHSPLLKHVSQLIYMVLRVHPRFLEVLYSKAVSKTHAKANKAFSLLYKFDTLRLSQLQARPFNQKQQTTHRIFQTPGGISLTPEERQWVDRVPLCGHFIRVDEIF